MDFLVLYCGSQDASRISNMDRSRACWVAFLGRQRAGEFDEAPPDAGAREPKGPKRAQGIDIIERRFAVAGVVVSWWNMSLFENRAS